MFLPLYVSEQLNNTTLSENDLVVRERSVLTTVKREEKGYFLASPLFWILAMVLFVLTITYIDYKNHVRSRLMDSILFFVTGLAGVVLIFLWFFTDHTATANNFNILWVFPLNLIIGFFIVKKNNAPSWLPKYLLFLLGLLGLTMFLAVFRVQVFSPLAIPLWIMLGVRYLFLWKFFRQHTSLK
jgi:hypothetical protein